MSEPIEEYAGNPNVQLYYHTVIPDRDGTQFLIREGEDGWALPCFDISAGVSERKLGLVNLGISKQTGLDVTRLRCLLVGAYDEAKETGRRDAVYLAENHSPDKPPNEGMTWVGREALGKFEMDDKIGIIHPPLTIVSSIELWLSEVESGVTPPRRAPWAFTGWYDEALTWIASRLDKKGIKTLGPVEQVRQWGISSIMLVPTEAGDVYFKAVPELFVREPTVTLLLASRFPEYVQMPLAIASYPNEGRLLMTDFGSKLADDSTLVSTESAVRALSRIQVGLVGDDEAMFAAGCADHRLETIPAELDLLLSDGTSLAGLDASEIERVHAHAPKLKEMCDRLTSYQVPQTLAHGDFHANNIAFTDGKPTIFDWTDACVSHPFLDLPVIFEYDLPKDEPDARTQLRDAYLQAWTDYEPIDRLLEAFALAEPLAALHQVISYKYITASLENSQKWEMEEGMVEWWRVLLKCEGIG